jgi:Rne/Rng family ribonuclease
MSKELIVSATRHETRIAILEDDSVVEIYYQREKEYSLAGSIHKGKVTRVLPGMQSAFVDIGLERDAFLYVSDFFEDNEEYDKVVSSVEDKVLKLEKAPERLGTESRLPETDLQVEAPVPLAEEDTDLPVEIALAEAESVALDSAPDSAPVGARPAEIRTEREPRGDGRDRDRGGRGGRGRRGRRRRGGPPSGIPDSKFYSPRKENADTEVVVASAPAGNTGEEEEEEDFPVLPGESLAKYSAPESAHERAHESKDEAEPVEEYVEPPAEPVLVIAETVVEPVVAESPVELAMVEPVVAKPVHAEPPPIPASVLVDESQFKHIEPIHIQVEVEGEAEPGASEIAEVPTAEAPTNDVEFVAEAAFTNEEWVEAAPLESAPSADGDADADSDGDAEPVIEEDEGPEPARIPTSLTAALREQGNRFPHRLSRRARRKMRGGGHHGEPRSNPAAVAPEAGAAERVEPVAEGPFVAAPAPVITVPEPRPQRAPRGERSERPERSGRPDRVERGERIDRGERTERPDRGERPDRTERPDRVERPDRERTASTSISELLREGQEIIVQIAKEPLGQKGARITSHIALPGRFLVYMPTVDHVGVSRKIPSDEERQRLKRILQTNRVGMTGGFIVRTAGDGKSEEELRADMHFLYNLWIDIRQKAEKKPAPLLLHHDLDLVQRILRDQLTSSFKTVWVDSEEAFESVLRFVQRFQPALVQRVKLYTRTNPIFDEFNITAELEKALRPKVWLKSGGYIVINQTEALVAIDVNTGKYVGKSNRLEDTIVRVNTDAIKEIVRQIRLRDLGGIIVVDFIDMDERKNRQKVMQTLEEAMRVDRAPYKILAFNDFGLVAITRKRVKQSLERTLCTPCPSCEGAGYIKSVQTVIGEILQEAQKMSKLIEGDDVLLRVNPEVAKVLKSNRNDFLQEIEELVGRTVMVKSDPTLHQTKFDLA